MEKPEIPLNEQSRLEALKKYNVLYTSAEKNFDDITMLVAEICQTPASMVSIIDAQSQWYKSKQGTELSVVPRDLSICAHAINKPDEIMHVTDLRNDDRFKGNPVLANPYNLVFYVGVPLVTQDGYALGTLCAVDNKPRQLNPHQLASLKILANQVMQLLELRKNNMELESLHAELKKRNDDLEHFSYMVSHDLQEPLRNITGIISLIDQKYLDVLDETGRSYFKHVVDGADRMKQLIHDILSYSKVTKNAKVTEKINMNDLVKEVVSLFTQKINDGNASIIVKPMPVIMAEKVAMIQIIQNLVSNALKYNKNPEPVVSISSEESETHWQFSVEDNGIGIDPAYSEKVFVVFKRLHTRSEYSGNGVGLAICKKIAERYDGNIWVENVPSGGSKFTFTIKK